MNFGDGEEEDNINWGDFVDIWKQLFPLDPGFTFDPETNILAKLTSRSGKQRRLDRVMVRSNSIRGSTMNMIGRDPITFQITKEEAELMLAQINDPEELKKATTVSIHPSDHFGVVCVLNFKQ